MPTWRQLRALLIALAIVLGLVDGCPGARNGTELRLAEQRLGPPLAGAVARLERVRARILRPVRPAADLFGLRQRWKLCSGAARKRFRMSIEVRNAGEDTWRLLYRPHDDEHDYRGGQIGCRRMRGAWNPHSTYGARGPAFAVRGFFLPSDHPLESLPAKHAKFAKKKSPIRLGLRYDNLQLAVDRYCSANSAA